ncbi:TIGR02569 family protein [Corynebacterium sp. HS2168-gen11]|uniref:TIGR02569 family protein n=1 Tax=Corynebacterium sp. HS2168-gen11 TaxID=2974027 RepID=UPI00216B00AE|nr:TIGR02569 family protein [Corynebacterium sp. HS2168-gen11]MCS4535824.1 TIGR02569 family protein [Corynebacterium sp. HS2168-gen11]
MVTDPQIPEITPHGVPDAVRDVFHLAPHIPAQRMGVAWDYGWRIADTVIMPVIHTNRAALSSRIREHLSVPGVRIVRPVRTSDGRFINGGWRASTWVAGSIARRVDETVAAALRLDESFAEHAIPESLQNVHGNDAFTRADQCAWNEHDDGLADFDPEIPAQEAAYDLIRRLRRRLRPLADVPVQLTHSDMFATTIYSGQHAPTVTDFALSLHPFGTTAAQTMIDALLNNAVDVNILRRYRHLAHLDQLLIRALLYRLYVHAFHPGATANTGTNLQWLTPIVLQHIDG